MRTQQIQLDELSKTLTDIISEYSDDVIRDMPDIVKEVAKETAKELKTSIDRMFGGSGAYKRSIKTKKLSENGQKVSYAVYSDMVKPLAQWLERSHVIKNQTGKVYGMSQAHPHWEPAEKHAIENLESKLRERAGGNS